MQISEKIPVAHLIHTIAYTGVETTVLNWVDALSASRFEPHLFCFANPGGTERPFLEAAASRGMEVECIPWHRGKPVLRAASRMAAHVRARRIAILHCHNSYAQLVAAATGWLTGVKTLTTFYVWGDFGWKRNVLQRIDAISARCLDLASAHCERTVAETVRRGIPAGRVRLLPSGMYTAPAGVPSATGAMAALPGAQEERARARRELGAGHRDVVLINVARFWPEKAHDVLLEAFRIVLGRNPDTLLWLAGSGPHEPEIRAAAERLSVAKRTRFLGFRDNVAEVLALADIQVHSSDMEGVPLALCEGMAAGLPVVATAVGGVPEIVRDGISGILAPPRRPYHLAQGILELIGNPEKRRRFGCAGRRFMQEEYSLEAAAARLQAVYEELLLR